MSISEVVHFWYWSSLLSGWNHVILITVYEGTDRNVTRRGEWVSSKINRVTSSYY